jgi:hypothetical protein
MTGAYLILKRGLYYCPNSQGYTGIKDYAGRYTEAEVRAITHPNGWDRPRDEMTFIHEDAAPAYSIACWQDLKERHMAAKAAAHAQAGGAKNPVDARDKRATA